MITWLHNYTKPNEKNISGYTITQLSKCKLLITGKIKAMYCVKPYQNDYFINTQLDLVEFKGDCVVVVKFCTKIDWGC